MDNSGTGRDDDRRSSEFFTVEEGGERVQITTY